jgi:replication fork protection complex subunit Csm3/Swi3
MIEKLGHSRRMQITRRTWIDESKPKTSIEDDDAEHEPLPATSNPGSQPSATGVKHQEHISAEASLRPSRGIDELDTTSQQRTNGAGPSAGSSVVDRGAPDDDELDALLAEDPDLSRTAQNGKLNEITPSQGSHRPNSRTEQSFEDDEEMLREFDMW